MRKKKSKKVLFILLGIFVLVVILFFGYFIVIKKDNPLFGIIDTLIENDTVVDNYNGIYVYYDDLNGSHSIYRGCSVSKIANYILVVNDDYYTFRSSCMATYVKEKGKVEDLDLKLDEEKKSYYIYYNEKTYDKDVTTSGIRVHNDIAEKLDFIDLSNYQLFMKETEFEGNYYDIEGKRISNLSSTLLMDIKKEETNHNFNISIRSPISSIEKPLYSVVVSDFKYLPDMYAYGSNVVIIEKKEEENRFKYQFKVVNANGVVYNLEDMFPIKVDDIILSKENSIYLTFDPSSRVFKLLMGFDNKMCQDNVQEEDKDDIVYYEFVIDYNYATNRFDKPKFSKIGYKKEGCRYINKLKGVE